MTSEELERALEFLLKSQAQSDSRINRLERVVGLAVRAGWRERRDTRQKIDALIAAQMHTDEAMTRLTQVQTSAEQTVADTNARLDRLAAIVEQHITGGHDQT